MRLPRILEYISAKCDNKLMSQTIKEEIAGVVGGIHGHGLGPDKLGLDINFLSPCKHIKTSSFHYHFAN